VSRIYDLRQKEIINVRDGCRFGFAADLEIDEKNGEISEVIVPGPAKVLGVFGREKEYRIPWDAIKRIGDDIILIDADTSKILKDCYSD
jgi:YlmC/YmxH family sporulation protein